jgi:hypothetical protein
MVRWLLMTKLVLVIALCGCQPPTTPNQPVAPLPPTTGEAPPTTGEAPATHSPVAPAAAKPAAVAFPAFPAIATVPASHPTGEPITVPFTLPRVGETVQHTMTSTFEQHYTYDGGTRYQKTDTKFDLDVKTLEVTSGHPSKIEVTANVAIEAVALGDSRDAARHQEETLLSGTYVVTAGNGGRFKHDEAHVKRPGGDELFGREQEELGSTFGPILRDGYPVERYVKNKRMRLGEAIVLDDEAKRALVGEQPLPGTFTLTLTRADTLVTYQLDVESVERTPGNPGKSTTELRMQGTITFDRTTGRMIEQRSQTHKVERYKDTVNDTFSSSVIIDKYRQ